MSVEEYWMGKGIDLEAIWNDYDAGQGYISKVASSDLHLLRITFSGHPLNLPLFDHEAIYKTIKGTFHDAKMECLTPRAYDEAAPIFLHRVDRGSGIYEFLAQFGTLSVWAVAVCSAYHGHLQKSAKSDEERIDFLRKNFPRAKLADASAYLKAWTTFGRRRILLRLMSQGLDRVEISRAPHNPTRVGKRPVMVNMDAINKTETGSKSKPKHR